MNRTEICIVLQDMWILRYKVLYTSSGHYPEGLSNELQLRHFSIIL